MNWRVVFRNFVVILVALFAFDLLYPRGGWWQSAARVSLLAAGMLMGDMTRSPRAAAPRET